MRRNTQAHVLSSLAVMLYVAAPTTIMLTAHETVRIDRMSYSATGDVISERHGSPGSPPCWPPFRRLRSSPS